MTANEIISYIANAAASGIIGNQMDSLVTRLAPVRKLHAWLRARLIDPAAVEPSPATASWVGSLGDDDRKQFQELLREAIGSAQSLSVQSSSGDAIRNGNKGIIIKTGDASTVEVDQRKTKTVNIRRGGGLATVVATVLLGIGIAILALNAGYGEKSPPIREMTGVWHHNLGSSGGPYPTSATADLTILPDATFDLKMSSISKFSDGSRGGENISCMGQGKPQGDHYSFAVTNKTYSTWGPVDNPTSWCEDFTAKPGKTSGSLSLNGVSPNGTEVTLEFTKVGKPPT
jgi:hypothetical protein